MQVLLPSLFSLLFVAIGGSILWYALSMAGKARRSLSWPSIQGEIAHSAVLYQINGTPNNGQSSTYKADIAYRYRVAGADYSGSKVSILDFATSNTGHAQEVVRRYPDKSAVSVYYNPSDPADAVLEPGRAGGINVLFGVGSIFAAGGCFFLLVSLTGHVHVR